MSIIRVAGLQPRLFLMGRGTAAPARVYAYTSSFVNGKEILVSRTRNKSSKRVIVKRRTQPHR